ncbi:MAG TPA: hypothetical protein VMD05_08670 [Candidatus Nanoarchaeia archaeon]|nr:hypothetical protein [Candidatus Nanoarchaeia archaeon]
MIETKFAKINTLWLIFPLSGIRISTVATAIASFSIVLFLQRTNTLKSVYFAILAVVVPMGLYEIVWYYIAVTHTGWDLKILEFAALFGWVLLGIREVFRTRPPRFSMLLYGVFAISMVVWVADGFQFNYAGIPTFNVTAEILNVVSKGSLFFAYALHIGSVKS